MNELRKIIRKQILIELSRIDPKFVRTKTKYWALHADLYEKLFAKINDRKKLQIAYKKLLRVLKIPERRDAATFFYRIRRDELDHAFVWS